MRVLVIRPEPGASATAERLKELGHESIVLPLTEIIGLPVGVVDIGAAIIAVTSANAIRHIPAELISRLTHMPVLAVGSATAEAAHAAGFGAVTDIDGDASDLAAALEKLSGRVLYLCGRVRTPDLESQLNREGRSVQIVETYNTVDRSPSLQHLTASIGDDPIDVVLVFSTHAARQLNRLLANDDARKLVGEPLFLCISKRVAEALIVPAKRILVSKSPNEAGLLSLLGTR